MILFLFLDLNPKVEIFETFNFGMSSFLEGFEKFPTSYPENANFGPIAYIREQIFVVKTVQNQKDTLWLYNRTNDRSISINPDIDFDKIISISSDWIGRRLFLLFSKHELKGTNYFVAELKLRPQGISIMSASNFLNLNGPGQLLFDPYKR